MVKALKGDIFKSRAQTLVNTVNCVGVMGKGIALGFKQRFPEMYEDYIRRCNAREVQLGKPYLYKRATAPHILNFTTKDHWRSVANLDSIVKGLEYLRRHYRDWGITSMAIPPLGCGEGQLEWRVVGPTLYRHLSLLDISVELYAPFGTPDEELQLSFLDREFDPYRVEGSMKTEKRMDPAWVALVEILRQVDDEPFHWPIGRVSFQKLAYFATEAGIPTGLTYRKGSFGPYAPDLKQITTRLVNNGLIREEHHGKMFVVKVGQTFEDAKSAYRNELEAWKPAIDRTADLFVRMRTNQAEVAATVHFAYMSLVGTGRKKPTEIEILSEVMKWKQRRRPPLKKEEIALAIRNLSMLGWLETKPSKNLPVPDERLVGV